MKCYISSTQKNKKTNVDLSKHMIEEQARLSLGVQAIVILLLSEAFIKGTAFKELIVLYS
ncbi:MULTISPECIES: hypothetical protein [Francisella]|uniref:Uncharacterized protein n=1 Tax=Francisella opportunistica TaxID=2016517 RepID=A0A345JQT5_9GAMM|nr:MULTISPECIES: hypothetical protein [Francisella]APC91390.1 hypothetical protein BBG19_0654 [Francisella sp. MA067296]AXH29681.1 hypothetical protein CGC43_03350 [Francisella opportunistica]AXH31331.1 hypothetical protein CGC44_03320 [Francisella opportunistica]AXH32977.1 hypothetical protein CGC45_03340 [Francisella opportunistica]